MRLARLRLPPSHGATGSVGSTGNKTVIPACGFGCVLIDIPRGGSGAVRPQDVDRAAARAFDGQGTNHGTIVRREQQSVAGSAAKGDLIGHRNICKGRQDARGVPGGWNVAGTNVLGKGFFTRKSTIACAAGLLLADRFRADATVTTGFSLPAYFAAAYRNDLIIDRQQPRSCLSGPSKGRK